MDQIEPAKRIKLSDKPCYLYHVTTQNWGPKRVLRPLSSNSKIVGNRGGNEPEIARICVGPDVARCLASIYWYIEKERVNIYRTARKVCSVEPWNVRDACVTQERWLLKSTTFHKVASISKSVIGMLPVLSAHDISDHFLKLKEIINILKENRINLMP